MDMGRTAIVVDKEYLKHLPGESHPERPERIKVMLDLAASLDPKKFALLPPRSAGRVDVEQIHGEDHIRLVESTSTVNRYALDGDTITSPRFFWRGAARRRRFLECARCHRGQRKRQRFCLGAASRPSRIAQSRDGVLSVQHHGHRRQISPAQSRRQRIMIVDWDVHHGNGTQDAFYDDPSVLFLSTHQFPYYPGTGAISEIGVGAGEGYTINVPLPAGCADRQYLQVFQDVIVAAAEKFHPEWILVSAGFDPHRRDPLGGMEVTEQGFEAMARTLLDLADKFCQGRIAFLLEGGYDLDALRNSAAVVLAELQQQHNKRSGEPLRLAESGVESDHPTSSPSA